MLLRELTSPKDTVEEGIVDIATKVADKATQGVNSILGKIENWYTSQKDENDLAWAEVELLLKPYAQELKDLIQDKRDMQMLMFMLERNQINKGFIRNLFDKIKRKGLRAVYKMEKEFGGFATEDVDEAMVPKDPNSVEVRVGNDINDILNGALVGKDMSDQINALSQKWLGGNEIEDDSEIHDAIRLVVYTHKGVPADQAEASEEALSIIDNLEDLDEGPTWARSGKKVVRKYRCSGGPRKNRIVSKLAQCFAPPNIKKRMQMKRMKARLGSRIIRKAKKTKRMNPASIRVQRLNKASRR